jgi:hypothetical protein
MALHHVDAEKALADPGGLGRSGSPFRRLCRSGAAIRLVRNSRRPSSSYRADLMFADIDDNTACQWPCADMARKRIRSASRSSMRITNE